MERLGQRLLLTGATGAIGPHVAARLIASGAASQIDVLLRPGGAISAGERFDHWMQTVRSIAPSHGGLELQIRPVAGDLRDDALSLSHLNDDEITRETEVILHAAADTRFRDCPDAQWDVNVEGTRRMIDLARRCRKLHQFILVSTTCVAGARTGRIDEISSSEPPRFINHYERTKWEAERLVLASGLPRVRIARISIVMGSEIDGSVHRPGALHRVLRWYGRGLIPLVPATPETTVDLISTETVARCLAKVVLSDMNTDRAIWHFAAGANRAARLPEMMQLVWDAFADDADVRRSRRRNDRVPTIVAPDRFARFRRTVDANRDPLLSQVMESVDGFLPGLLAGDRAFDTSEAQRLWGGELPVPDWRTTLRRVIHASCLRRGDAPIEEPSRRPRTGLTPV